MRMEKSSARLKVKPKPSPLGMSTQFENHVAGQYEWLLVFDMAMSQLVGNAAETPETHIAIFRRNLYLHF